MNNKLEILKGNISSCKICEEYLENGCNPVVVFNHSSRIIIIGQAPGRLVHESGIPWSDKSGKNLMDWMGVTKDEFYNENLFAIVPMGFCYPGSGKSGDLPPRKECAPLWHTEILQHLRDIELILLIGQYAQSYYLKTRRKKNLTETVRAYEEYLPDYFPLPHPSPRNNIWLKKNLWFRNYVIPELKQRVHKIVRENID